MNIRAGVGRIGRWMDGQVTRFQTGSGDGRESDLAKEVWAFLLISITAFLSRVLLPPVSWDPSRLDTENSSGSSELAKMY